MNISQVLELAPKSKAKEAYEAETLRQDWINSKDNLKRAEGLFYIQTKTINPKMTQKDLQAMVDSDEDLLSKRYEVNTNEAKFRSKMVRVEEINDTYNSAKMLSRLKIGELTETGGV